jgi:hypothetical protein
MSKLKSLILLAPVALALAGCGDSRSRTEKTSDCLMEDETLAP